MIMVVECTSGVRVVAVVDTQHIFQCVAELCYMTTLTAIQCIAVK